MGIYLRAFAISRDCGIERSGQQVRISGACTLVSAFWQLCRSICVGIYLRAFAVGRDCGIERSGQQARISGVCNLVSAVWLTTLET